MWQPPLIVKWGGTINTFENKNIEQKQLRE